MLSGLLLLAAAVASVAPSPEAHAVDARSPSTATVSGGAIAPPDTDLDAPGRGSPAAQIPALFPAEPRPVPQDLITSLEAASGEPLPVELGRLLSAIQEGFGVQSVQLAPELRPYAFRMASRFDWNPDTFRVAVTAPTADLAEARAATLRRLFESAVGAERLQVRSGAGPHALTLVSDS